MYIMQRMTSLLQLQVFGFKTLGQGCSELQTVLLNDMFTLDDACIKVSAVHACDVRLCC